MTAQSISAAIASLLERGLVARAPHPTHGRIPQGRITGPGVELLAHVQIATKQVEDRAVSSLNDQQQQDLRAILRQLMHDMDLYLPEVEHEHHG